MPTFQMFRRKKFKPIKQISLEDLHIKKSEKAKFGGMGVGGVYRNKLTGKDYLIKRIDTPYGNDFQRIKDENWRSWDEILAARCLKAAGILVPNMFAVEDKHGLIYVASSLIPGAKDCKPAQLKSLPPSAVDAAMTSQLVHCWLGNRDIINIKGDNYVVDKDFRLFNVDLGAALYSGFRAVVGFVQDSNNYNPNNLESFLVERHNPNFGKIINKFGNAVFGRNTEQTRDFFSQLLFNPANERKYQLQGGLLLRKMDDQTIEELVNSTGHTAEDKLKRIIVLKARRDNLLQYLQNKYGKYALLEEQLELGLQRIFHKQGCFAPYPSTSKGSDSVISFRSQFQNAIKPTVRIQDEENVTVSIETNSQVSDAQVEHIFSQFSSFREKIKINRNGSTVHVTLPLALLKENLDEKIITHAFQVFFASHNYLSDIHFPGVYKGDGHTGFLPKISVRADNVIALSLPAHISLESLKQQLVSAFDIDPDYLTTEQGWICVHGITLEDFAQYVMQNTGVRKTAIVSENEHGEILAGKLDVDKKGVSGFATAGGGSDYPYHPDRAAREEGAEELGHSIASDAVLIPIGSTLPNKKKNIFLVQSGGTNETPDTAIPYPEFMSDSIKYYSFRAFAEAYQRDKSKFDRSSMDLYLRYYQREIQKVLHTLHIENVIVHISKKPESIGRIVLKPSLDGSHKGLRTLYSPALISLLDDIIEKKNYRRVRKDSPQGKHKINGEQILIPRENIALDESISPSHFLRLLQKKAMLQPQKAPEKSSASGQTSAHVPQATKSAPTKSNSNAVSNQIASWRLQAFLAIIFAVVAVIAFVLAMLAVHAAVGGDPFIVIRLGSLLLKTTPLILGTAAAAVCVVGASLSLALAPISFFNASKSSAPKTPPSDVTPKPAT